MAISGEDLMVHAKKVMMFLVRTSYRSSCDHPLVFSLVLFILMLYGSFPTLFAFLVSVSPVIFCTALLLGLLLSYGAPSISEIKEEEEEEEDKGTNGVSSLKIGASTADLFVEKDESLSVENHVGNSTDIQEIGVRQALLSQRDDSVCDKSEGGIYAASTQSKGDEKADMILAAGLLVKDNKVEIHDEDKLTQERELEGQEISDSKEIYVEKPVKGVQRVGKEVSGSFTTDPVEGLKLAIAELSLDDQFDSILGSPWQHINRHDAFDSESDHAESSSPDASMTDITPMLDELHPFLDSEHPQHPLLSKDDSDVSSQESLSGKGSDDNIIEEESKNHEEEKDEEANEEKDGVTEAAVMWTKEDQKNVMDLDSSELEKNQRLESLIAKRRASKNMQSLMEKKLIDLNGIDYLMSMEKVSDFHVQLSHISAPRRNPFDSQDDSEDSMGLPPIPGSAPSRLAHRGNPFDYFHDSEDEHSSFTDENWAKNKYMPVPNCDIFIRYGAFNVGGRELKQERGQSRFKPKFVSERTDSEEESSFQRQLSDSNDLKVNSTRESDTMFKNQEYHKELVEHGNRPDIELSSSDKSDDKITNLECRSFAKVESFDVEEEKSGFVTNDCGIDLETKFVIEETHQDVNDFASVEEKIREEKVMSSPISDTEEGLEGIEENYNKASYSSTLEEDEVRSKRTFHEESVKLQQTRELSESVLSDSEILRMAGKNDDYQVADSICNSSPLEAENSLSQTSLCDEDFLGSGKEGPGAGHSWVQAEVVGVESSQGAADTADEDFSMDLLSVKGNTVEKLLLLNEGFLMTSQRIVSTEANESRSGEITRVRQHDVIQDELSSVQGDSSQLFSSMIPEPVDSVIMHDLSSVVSESSESTLVGMTSSTSRKGDEMIDASKSSFSDILSLSDDLVSSASALDKTLLLTEKSGTQPSSGPVFGKPHSSILVLSPIPEENIEDLKPDEEKVKSTNPDEVCLSGLQIIEEPNNNVFDVKQFPHTEETGQSHSSDRLVHELEFHNSSVLIADVSSHHGEITEFQSVEPTESMDFSSLPKMKSVFEVNFSQDSAKSRHDIQNAVWEKKEVPYNLESSDEVHQEDLETTDIDESLLSELDAVGDFHVEEITPNQQGIGLKILSDVPSDYISTCPSSSDLHLSQPQPEVSVGKSSLHADMSQSLPSGAKFYQSEELYSVVNNPKDIESKVGTSFWTSSGDPEQTVYNPKQQILASSSIQEILKRLHEEDIMPSPSELNDSKSLAENSVLEPSEIVNSRRDVEQTLADSELLVLEAKSIEDIHSAFSQISEGRVFKPIAGSVHLEPTEIHSDLRLTEAKSPEDMEGSFKHQKPEVLEVQSGNDIRESCSGMEQGDHKSEVGEVPDDIDSHGSTSRKTQNHQKFSKSDSSSSSSASLSDSD